MMFHTFNRPRPRIMVVSHERSGTHFLMNSLAKCYGYLASPWINFDFELGINFYSPPTVAAFFGQFANQNLANIVKAHHSFAFFESALASIVHDFHIFYVYRDPRDVMVSYWKFIQRLEWHEGPKTQTCSEFIRAEPAGQMMRYQHHQEESVIHRWLTHVDGWTMDVPENLRNRVTYVRFRDLAKSFEKTILSFAPIFGERPTSIERPSLHENSILPNAGTIGSHKEHMNADDLQLFEDIAGPTMKRLGFMET